MRAFSICDTSKRRSPARSRARSDRLIRGRFSSPRIEASSLTEYRGAGGFRALPAPLPPVSPLTRSATLRRSAISAAATAGGVFVNYPAGPDPAAAATGFDAIVADPPDILIVGAIDPTLVTAQAKQLLADGVTVVWGADPRAPEILGLQDTLGGMGGSIVNGEVLAAAAVYFTCGTGTDLVWYNMPEFLFSTVNHQGAEELLKQLSPNASMRSVDISIFATDNPNGIVQDLQSHPDTQFFITPGDQFQIGLAAAAKTAGIENAQGIGQSSLPQNVVQIQEGTQYGGFTFDFQQFLFQLVDEGLRKYEGVFPKDGYGTDWRRINANISTLITQQNVDGLDIGPDSNYYSYPNTVADYAKAWGR